MKSATHNFTKLKYANLVEWNSILTPSCRETRSWSLFFVFILLQVLLCSRKYMKLPKFGILVNKTTYLFTSVKSNISRGCVKILEILEGSGGGGEGVNFGGWFWKIIWQIPSVGVVWIFSAGTTQCLIPYINVRVSNYCEANANLRFFYFNNDF